jgi:hypothetical protein
VTIAGIGHPASFFFVFGGDGKFDAEAVIIERSNLELAGGRCPSTIGLRGRKSSVPPGLHRSN